MSKELQWTGPEACHLGSTHQAMQGVSFWAGNVRLPSLVESFVLISGSMKPAGMETVDFSEANKHRIPLIYAVTPKQSDKQRLYFITSSSLDDHDDGDDDDDDSASDSCEYTLNLNQGVTHVYLHS